MYPSFTGKARPKRQVNLSGRNSNPFAAHSVSGPSSVTQTTQTAVAQAQQERAFRQKERERPPAAIKIQQTWRGHRIRRQAAQQYRQEWDQKEESDQSIGAGEGYRSEKECFEQLRLLNRFVAPYVKSDVQRLHRFSRRYMSSIRVKQFTAPEWIYPRLRLAKKVMESVRAQLNGGSEVYQPVQHLSSDHVYDFLNLLASLAGDLTVVLATYSHQYYSTLAIIADQKYNWASDVLNGPILALLSPNHERTDPAYDGFIMEGLCSSSLSLVFSREMRQLVTGIDYEIFAHSLDRILNRPDSANPFRIKTHEQLLWLLADFISIRSSKVSMPSDAKYVRIVSKLVSFLADDIIGRVDTQSTSETNGIATEPLPDFVRSSIISLVSQDNIKGLLTNLDVAGLSSSSGAGASEDATALASYALMLLRVFPRRGDEIRMWLYQGSTSVNSQRFTSCLPAIKYFFQAASATHIFKAIIKDARAVLEFLRPKQSSSGISDLSSRNQQWRIILLFLELYSFPLKIMDDEEFLSGSSEVDVGETFIRQSALPLYQIETLTIFLKNLTFAMYWNASELAGTDDKETRISLAAYFGKETGGAQPQEDKSRGKHDMAVAGVSGLTLEYVKRMATGVLRMLYERDSRRKFLPKGHWLMTRYFEMDRFISAVVSEEEAKNKIERSFEDGEDREVYEDDDETPINNSILVGTSHVQQIRNSERLKRQQKQSSRKKYLESVTPRLEILQNLPFFIPFDTRVQIFREFVTMDQVGRRGTADADEWRFLQINSTTGNISRHRAKVRRKKVFEDAYAQFYELGEGLKEPIQIRFVDEFDTVEEGIDGGGVTKEFLTSITAEAFGSESGSDSLFVENDQHLLFPNPSAIEERKELLRQATLVEGSAEWIDNIRDLLRQYEFLGRIVGKCLYEGILIDIHFAPFFLLKWALTGGSRNAARESAYRANINDLRDLDEGLYQGLLQLKNYTGNVEDLSLTFSVDNVLHLSPTETKTVHHELQPGGEQMAVTNANRLIYIAHMARYRLQIQSRLQTDAFLRGLGTIVSPSWLSMFNQSELQTLVGGTSTEVNIADLRANTQYGGIYAIGDDGAEHPSIQLFWKVMQDLEDADKKKVLKFVTSTPRAPLLGFGNLNPLFSIRDSGSNQTRLPTTSTCVNLLKLPIYKDERTLKERLLYSVNSGAGFNLS